MNSYSNVKTNNIFSNPDYVLPGRYPNEDFLEIYERELKRSYRTDVPLTMVTIKIESVSEMNPKNPDTLYYELLNNLTMIVTSFLREDDITHLNSNNLIRILLLDTSLSGAQEVQKKITQQLVAFYNSLSDEEKKSILNRIKFNLIPLSMIAKNDKNETKVDSISITEFLDGNHLHNDELLDSSDPFKLKVLPTSQGAMALNIPIPVVGPTVFFKIFKRFFDIAASSFGLFIFSPFFAIISIAIKFSSKGPIFYKQERLGKSGNPFLLYKFRTMRTDSDDSTHRDYVKKLISGDNSDINQGTSDNPLFKLKKDPRITSIGNILRKTSLDEVPQLINIFKSEMSLVGPRPPIPYEVEAYKNWHLRRILEAKPGLTGLWQTSGKNKTTFEEMVRLDLQYIKRQSAWLDLKIVLKTLPAMLNKDV